MRNNQTVSIIITTKNEEDVLEGLIRSIHRQSFSDIEIILVDNNSTDKTAQIAKKSGIKFYNHGPERSAQRNYGAKCSKGKYLLFVDADMQLAKDVVKQCVNVADSDDEIGAIVIPEISEAHSFWEKVKGFERSFYNEKGDQITDAARFFSKKAFTKGGGYDESITGPEDWDLPETLRELGYKIGRISAKIFHKERVASPVSLAKKKFYYGLRAYKYLDKHNINHFGPKTIYFLRPVFYRNIDKIVKNPILSFGMILMLSAELIGGGLGYFWGRMKKL